MTGALHPLLYQVNPRVWLAELSRRLGRRATLADIPDQDLDRLAALGFNWIWLLSVWQTGLAGQRASRCNPAVRRECEELLPDGSEEDIVGSGFAITGYTVQASLGGEAALARLRQRLRRRGLRLMLDFVPNHTALDHPWVEDHPDRFIRGTEQDLARAPGHYVRVQSRGGERILAHGRDPYFPAWSDTLQLNYGHAATQGAMREELLGIARQCDGVRCDMAMLILPEVFERTWGGPAQPFWPDAMQRVRERVPDFCFLAEVYWGLERTLQQQGFDYTYDKSLYDRLREGQARPVREHFRTDRAYQNQLTHFLENHDEPRAAVVFPPAVHEAAAVISFLAPGLRFFHQGQLEGHLKRLSPHLGRGPDEPANPALRGFYERLLQVLRRPVLRHGEWQLLDCVAGEDGPEFWDSVVAFGWQVFGEAPLVVLVNFAGQFSQCRLRLPFCELSQGIWRLRDLWSDAQYEGAGAELQSRGFKVELGPWQSQVLEVVRL